MNDEWFAWFSIGALVALVAVLVLIAVTDHNTFETVDAIPELKMYSVVVDGREFVCQNAPVITHAQVTLRKCDGLEKDDTRIKDAATVSFSPIERDE